MKKINVTVSFDEEKVSALKMYLAEKEMSIETETEKFLESLYEKTVPVQVRRFLEMRTNNESVKVYSPSKKQKPEKTSNNNPTDI